jgi:hypothetical protein
MTTPARGGSVREASPHSGTVFAGPRKAVHGLCSGGADQKQVGRRAFEKHGGLEGALGRDQLDQDQQVGRRAFEYEPDALTPFRPSTMREKTRAAAESKMREAEARVQKLQVQQKIATVKAEITALLQREIATVEAEMTALRASCRKSSSGGKSSGGSLMGRPTGGGGGGSDESSSGGGGNYEHDGGEADGGEVASFYTELEPKVVNAWLIEVAVAVADKNPAAAEIEDMNKEQYERAKVTWPGGDLEDVEGVLQDVPRLWGAL